MRARASASGVEKLPRDERHRRRRRGRRVRARVCRRGVATQTTKASSRVRLPRAPRLSRGSSSNPATTDGVEVARVLGVIRRGDKHRRRLVAAAARDGR
eukprot:5341-Pelagococcus_subviridis.AAC.2